VKWIFLLTVLLLTSCFKKNEYPSVPQLYFEEFTPTGDSAYVVLRFEDGEGDIGLNPDATEAPYNVGSKYEYNLYLVYYEKVNGKFQVGKDANGDSIIFKNRLRPVYEGKPKSISGKITYTLSPFYYNFLSEDSDTIRYEIQIIARALNDSAWIQTDPIIR
jgi:hypothetical protein